ncbi:MAG: alpha/beta fold hydrolase [Negativicutes bacterium]|nr:alpha/beta fold hydrolase [Negativicutes bacterium]
MSLGKTSVRHIFCLLVLSFFAISTAHAEIKEEAVFLPTRPGVIQPFVVTSDSEAPPKAIAILFAGSLGYVGIKPDQPVTNGNFLVRARRHFVKNSIATAVVDCPSDSKDGIGISFRTSKEHAADISAVIDEMNQRFPGLPVYLVGTSMGTISSAYVAEKIQSKVKGVISTSTVFNAENFFPKGLTIPVLLVHNTDDGCSAAPYGGATAAARSYGYPLISVHGGSFATGKEACGPYSPHGYLTKEVATISAIANWVFGRPFEKDIY